MSNRQLIGKKIRPAFSPFSPKAAAAAAETHAAKTAAEAVAAVENEGPPRVGMKRGVGGNVRSGGSGLGPSLSAGSGGLGGSASGGTSIPLLRPSLSAGAAPPGMTFGGQSAAAFSPPGMAAMPLPPPGPPLGVAALPSTRFEGSRHGLLLSAEAAPPVIPYGGQSAAAAAAKPVADDTLLHINGVHYMYNLPKYWALQRLLSLADNIHDGWNGFRNKEPSESEAIRKALLDIYLTGGNEDLIVGGKTLSTIAKEYINRLLDDKPNGISICNIEDSVISWFEDNINFLSRRNPSAVKTYDEIIAAASGKALANEVRNDNDVYYLKPGVTDIDKIVDSPNNKKIQDFILQFLLGSTVANTYMTFDAAPKVVGKIFRNHANVSGLIIPQNIGDSATTSFAKLGKNNNLYIFPILGDIANTFICNRNIITGDGKSDNVSKLTMYYKNEDFCEKTPYHFSFGISEDTTITRNINKTYKDGAKQGPALDYLLELVLKAQKGEDAKFESVTPATACLQIGDRIRDGSIKTRIIDELGAIFFDIKRGGDQHVALAVLVLLTKIFIEKGEYIILVTLDRMLSLLARLLGIPCILHYNDTMTLYKNKYNDRSLKPEILAALLKERDTTFVEQYKGLYNLYASADTRAKITLLLTSLEAAARVEKAATDEETTYNIQTNRINDIHAHLTKLLTLITESNNPLIDFSKIDPTTGANIIKSFLTCFESNNFDSVMLLGLGDMLTAPSPIFDRSKEYPLFKYSPKQFIKLRKAKQSYDSAVVNNYSKRIPKNYDELLNNSDGYNTLLNELEQTFYNTDEAHRITLTYLYRAQDEATQALITEAKRLLKIHKQAEETYSQYNANPIRFEKDRQALKDAIDAAAENARQASEYLRTALKQSAAPLGPYTPLPIDLIPCQKGGAYSSNKIEVFKEICAKAGVFMNSQISNIFPEISIKYALLQVKRYERILAKTPQTENLLAAASEHLSVATMRYIDILEFQLQDMKQFYQNLITEHKKLLKEEDATNISEDLFNITMGMNHVTNKIREITTIKSFLENNYSEETINWANAIHIDVDTVVRSIVTSSAVELLLELHNTWSYVHTGDPTDTMIKTILSPYDNDYKLLLRHPLVTGVQDPAPGTVYYNYMQKEKNDNKEGYYNIDRPTVYALLALTILDDLFKGNVTANTSAVISGTLGVIPSAGADYDITTQKQWEKLADTIRDLFIQINNGNLSHESIKLHVGGARKPRRNRTRKLHVKRRRTIKRRRS